MKTIEAINSEIENLRSEAEKIKVDLKEAKMLPKNRRSLMTRHAKILKEVKFLKSCILFLNTKPSRDYLVKEKDRLSTRLKLIDTEFSANWGHMAEAAMKVKKKEVYKTMGVAETKSHLKNISFLLNQ